VLRYSNAKVNKGHSFSESGQYNRAQCKGEVNVSLCLVKYDVMKTALLIQAPQHDDVWVSGNTAPSILNLGTTCRWVVRFMTQPLYPQYPLGGRLRGPQSRSERGGWEPNPGHPAHSLVITLTELPRVFDIKIRRPPT